MMTARSKSKVLFATWMLTLVNAVQAESSLVGNIGITTNYIWRGISQSNDRSAVSAGLDYTDESGWYVGGWTSSLDGNHPDNHYELDLYIGYRFQAGPLDMNIGYIDYRYPVGSAPTDFGEVYVNTSFEDYSMGVAYSIRDENNPSNLDNLYSYIGTKFEIKSEFYLDLIIGAYDFDDPARTDYTHRIARLRKGNFSISFHKTTLSGTDGDTRWSGSWKKEFDL